MRKIKLVLCRGFMISACLGAPALALGAAPYTFDQHRVTVDFADLNIESDAGAKALYRRLESAAEKACDVDDALQTRSLRAHRYSKKCFDAALAEAVDEIDSDKLDEIHQG